MDENVGLGPARNAGFAAATGDYVWFVDSDDWVADGALDAVARRIRQTNPDLVLVNFDRIWWTQGRRRSGLAHLLPPASTPEIFTGVDVPNVLMLFPSAWSRVIRAETLRKSGLTFPAGYYEDLPLTYALHLTEARTSVVYRVCYYYRQRRCGAITATEDARHLEIFDQ